MVYAAIFDRVRTETPNERRRELRQLQLLFVLWVARQQALEEEEQRENSHFPLVEMVVEEESAEVVVEPAEMTCNE